MGMMFLIHILRKLKILQQYQKLKIRHSVSPAIDQVVLHDPLTINYIHTLNIKYE